MTAVSSEQQKRFLYFGASIINFYTTKHFKVKSAMKILAILLLFVAYMNLNIVFLFHNQDKQKISFQFVEFRMLNKVSM